MKLEGYINASGFGVHTNGEENFKFEYTNTNDFIDDYFSVYLEDKEYVKISNKEGLMNQLEYTIGYDKQMNLRNGFWPNERENLFQIVTLKGEKILDGTDLMNVGAGISSEGASIQIDFQYGLEEYLCIYAEQGLEVVYVGEVIETIEYKTEDITPFLTIMINVDNSMSKSEVLSLYNALSIMCYESQ